MAETIEMGCGGSAKWHWYNVKNDLVQQGGLDEKDVIIDPFTVGRHGCRGRFKEKPFFITWVKDAFLLLSMVTFSSKLVNAFAVIVGYEPLARYDCDAYTTVEWDKLDPKGRWGVLLGLPALVRLGA